MKNVLFAGLLVTSTLAVAEDYKIFAGAEALTSELNFNQGKSGYELGFGLRGGFLASDHRIYAIVNMHDKLDTYSLLAAADALSEPYKMADWYSISFFAGFHVGYNNTDKGTAAGAVGGAQYGVQGGIMGHFPGNFTAEVGTRFAGIDIKNIDYLTSYYAALNYKF